jgi:hypothetical protein
MRHITFLRPSLGEGFSADAMTPLAFAILKACTPPEIATTMVDERVEPLRMVPTELAAKTVETFTARRTYQIAAASSLHAAGGIAAACRCRALALIGFESLDRESLVQMRKKWNGVAGGYDEMVRRFHSLSPEAPSARSSALCSASSSAGGARRREPSHAARRRTRRYATITAELCCPNCSWKSLSRMSIDATWMLFSPRLMSGWLMLISSGISTSPMMGIQSRTSSRKSVRSPIGIGTVRCVSRKSRL